MNRKPKEEIDRKLTKSLELPEGAGLEDGVWPRSMLG